MSSSYYHEQLNDGSTWDDIKRIFGLRAPTIEKLQANNPYDEASPDGKAAPPSHAWINAGIVLHDAKQLWDHLAVTVEETPDGKPDAGNSTDPPVADKPPRK